MLSRLATLIPREGRLLILAALGMLVVGWLKGINLLILLSLVVCAIVLVNGSLAGRQLKRLHGRRLWRNPIFADSKAHWNTQIVNISERPAAGLVIEDASNYHAISWFVDQLPSHQSVLLSGSTLFPHRGRQQVQPLRASCLHPFGLIRRQHDIGQSEECLVLPSLGKLHLARFRRWLARVIRSEGRRHRVARPSMIRQDDLHGLRPFRPGDNPRWIHWRTSARRNMKMVREFEETAGIHLIVVVDPTSYQVGARDFKLEMAISLAATICWEWCRQDEDFLMLALAGAEPIVRRGHTSSDLALGMLAELALLEGQQTPTVTALEKILTREIIPPAPVLLVGARPNEKLRAQLAERWKRTVVEMSVESASEFYEPPGASVAKPRPVVPFEPVLK